MANITQRPAGRQVARGMADPFDQIFESMMPAFFRPVRLTELMGEGVGRAPSIDIVDRDNEIVVKADIPGIKKEDLDIQVQGNQVFISGQVQDESEQEQGNYLYRERRFGSFSRSIQLPEEVDSNQAKATCHDGILELVLPKAESAKRKKIEIQ
ncbi:MAG: Hsp20/alpha crystallin family protein [Pseudomonadota bacterium]